MMAIFGSRKQPQPTQAKKVWGDTDSQRKLGRRLAGIIARFVKVGLDSTGGIQEVIDKLHSAGDEDGMRQFCEEGEEAITVYERAYKLGGVEFVHYLVDEKAAGRLPATDSAFNEAVEAFSRKKQMDREEAERREASERHAREEPLKRAREIEALMSRIDALPEQTAGPLRLQLKKLPIDGKPRDYRKAVHDVEVAIAHVEE